MLKINLAVHGYPGAGKSRLLRTAPGPILTLDAEGGGKWLGDQTNTAIWDPAQPLPSTNLDGSPIHTDTMVRVIVRDIDAVKRALDWLLSGNHYFESAEWDSATDIQVRCKKNIRGMSEAMSQEMWGKLLDQMVDLVRAFRDLTDHPVRPVNVFMSALTVERGKNTVKLRPDLQGALGDQFAQYFDVLGYMYTELVTNGDQQVIERRLLLQPFGDFVAKDRTDVLSQRYGFYVPNPNLTVMSQILNGGES